MLLNLKGSVWEHLNIYQPVPRRFCDDWWVHQCHRPSCCIDNRSYGISQEFIHLGNNSPESSVSIFSPGFVNPILYCRLIFFSHWIPIPHILQIDQWELSHHQPSTIIHSPKLCSKATGVYHHVSSKFPMVHMRMAGWSFVALTGAAAESASAPPQL